MSDSREFEKKLSRHRLVKLSSVLAVIASVWIVMATISSYINSKTYEVLEVKNKIAVTQSANAKWVKLGDNIVTYTPDGASCVNEKGEMVWNRAYELQDPMIDTCGTSIGIAEYNGSVIYLMNAQKEVAEIPTGMPIKAFTVASNGMVAAVLEDGSTTWIYLFDSKGTELINFKTTMQDSGYPIELDLSDNGMLLAVSFITVDNVALKSRVAFYNFGEVGQNKSDMLVSGYDYSDTIVPTIQFVDGGSVFSVGNNRLMVYEGSEIPLHSAETLISDEIRAVVFSNNYAGLLFYNTDQNEKYNLSIYNTKAALIGSVRFDMYYSEIIIDGNHVIVYNENEIQIYKTDGQLMYQELMNETLKKVLCTSKSNRFVLVFDSGMQIIELR